MQLTVENSTHLLKCRHCVGSNCKTYYMPCQILKTMPNGRLKLAVFGDRYWKNKDHICRIRYVDANRVRKKN